MKHSITILAFASGLQVPRSSKEVTSDSDYLMYRVILFRRVADTFKTNARQAGFQVHKQQGGCAAQAANTISCMCRTTCGQLALVASVPPLNLELNM